MVGRQTVSLCGYELNWRDSFCALCAYLAGELGQEMRRRFTQPRRTASLVLRRGVAWQAGTTTMMMMMMASCIAFAFAFADAQGER